MRVVFFGSPAFAVPSLEAIAAAGHTVVGAVTQPDRPRGRGQRTTAGPVKLMAAERGIPVLQPERLGDAGFREAFHALRSEIGVVAAYGKILPEWLLSLPSAGMINVHASLLPQYRGAAPVHRAILAGASETGVTIMRVVTTLDAGPMLDRLVVPIDGDATSEELEATLARVGARLLVDVLGRLQHGPVPETPQADGAATYASKLTRADGVVDWSRPAQAIHNQIRGLQPWPRASSRFQGGRVILHRSRVTSDESAAPPGTIVAAAPAGVDVAAGDGRLLRLVSVQAEGRRRMTAGEFLGAHHLAPGLAFERS